MLTWSELDPARFERAVQQLLRTQLAGLVSLDGAGGDGGCDAQLITKDGLTVFETKSFRKRLTSSQRRQVESSLKTAVQTASAMTGWVLILPLNQSPSELTWFTGRLADLAPGVRLEWRGIDWLDSQATANEAFRRYVEGANSQLLKAASELGLEQAILANGPTDLFTRNTALRERVDAISMHWTLDWAIQGRIQTYSLRAKHDEADQVDPIKLKTTVSFDPGDAAAVAIREQWEDVLGYGGSVDLDEKYVTRVAVEGSEEAQLLLSGMREPGGFALHGLVTTLDQPIRATIEVQPDEPGEFVTRADVWFRTRTGGSQGVHLHGEDPAGTITVDLRVPYPKPADPDVPDAPGVLIDGATFNVSFSNPWQHPVADIVAALRLHTAMRAGGKLTIRVHGLVLCMTSVPADNDALDYSVLLRIAEVVQRFEERLGLQLKLPDGATRHEVEMAEAAAAALDDEPVELPFDTFTATIVPGHAQDFVSQLPEEPFALFSAHTDYVVTIGDLEIPYGPLAMSLPQIILTNRAELLAASETDEPVAKFKTAGSPMYFTGRANAEEHAAQLREESSDPDEAA